jgi:hypothetical protein
MSAITLGIDEIKERLHLVCRRRNWVALQHLIYTSVGLLFLGAAGVVLAALRGSTLQFRVVLWGAAVTVLSGILHAAYLLRRNWVSLERAVELADRQGRLEDRLSTLFARPSQGRPSRLRPLLLAQVLAARKSWDARTLTPRLVPRSVYFTLASLCVLLATGWIDPQKIPAEAVTAESLPQPTQSLPESIGRSTKDASPVPFTGAQGEGNASPHGHATGGKSPGDPPANGVASERLDVTAAGTQRFGGGEQPRQVPGGTPQARGLLQEAFGSGSQSSVGRAATKREQSHRGHDPKTDGKGSVDRPKPHMDGQTETQASRTTGKKPGNARTGKPGEAGAGPGRSGEAAAGSGKGLFGGPTQKSTTGEERPLPLRLGALGTITRGAAEQSRQRATMGLASAGAGSGVEIEWRADGADSPDDPMQRALIPPQHEGIVRRIFDRRE